MAFTPTLDDFKADYGAIFDEFTKRGWTDGLPIVPPNEERVAQMVAATDLPRDHVLGEIPPRRAHLTVEMLAINAVMAGCRPEYFPVVIAGAEALLEPEFALFSLATTTNPATELLLINGPIRKQLDINDSYGFLGPGWRANATIGRALKLAERNVGGTIPGETSKSTNAQPGRYGTLVFGEREELSPWAPLHTTLGFKATDNVVTVYPAVSSCNIVIMHEKDAKAILDIIAQSITYMGTNTYFHGNSDPLNPTLIVMCPDHANVIGSIGGMSRADVQNYLLEHARRPITDWPEKYREKMSGGLTYRDGYVYLHLKPEQFLIAVAGGDGGHQTVFFPNFGNISRRISKPIWQKGEARS